MRIQKSSRWLVILLAIVVVIITTMVVANATQTITTPNAAFISFNLAPGASSAAITPASNRSVLVMGCLTNETPPPTGHVSLIHHPGNGMGWSGVESFNFFAGTSTITSGASAKPGTHIVYLDLQYYVDIQVNDADTILIHNRASAQATGNVTLIW